MTDYYIDPVDGNDTTGDGLGEATAWKTWAKVGTTNSWAAGNTYYQKGGTTGTGQIRLTNATGPTDVAGAAGSPITITTKSGWGTGYAVLNGAGTLDFGIFSNTLSKYINVSNFEVKNCTTRGIYIRNSLNIALDCYCTFENNYIHDITGSEVGEATGIWGAGTNAMVRNNIVTDCGDDCIHWEGDGISIIGNNIARPGTDASNSGDNIQIANGASGAVVINNVCDHSNVDEKQCIIVQDADPATCAPVLISGNTCVFPVLNAGTSVTKAVFIGVPGTVSGNRVTGGVYGVWIEGTAVGPVYVYGNIVTDSYSRGIAVNFTGTEYCYVRNNTICDVVGDGINQYDASVEGDISNNVVTGCGRGIYKAGTAVTASTNCQYGNTSGYVGWQPSAGNLSADPLLQSDYSLGAGSPARSAGTWIAGVRAYDDLPLPLHPDIGAVQDRTAPGRRFGAGGGTL